MKKEIDTKVRLNEVIASVLALQEELATTGDGDVSAKEIVFKLNSVMYSTYPCKDVPNQTQRLHAEVRALFKEEIKIYETYLPADYPSGGLKRGLVHGQIGERRFVWMDGDCFYRGK